MFVDSAGTIAKVIDPVTGEIHEDQVFVATLGASSYSYAGATWTQSLPIWLGALMASAGFSRPTPFDPPPQHEGVIPRPSICSLE